MKIVVIDYGLSNLGSIKGALEKCGASVLITSNPDDIVNSSGIILPGVGSFSDGIKNLRERKLDIAIKQTTAAHTPILGICLGMQLLASSGQEGGNNLGLDLISGEVIQLIPTSPNIRIPHVGWNEVNQTKKDSLFKDIPNGTDFYFVHSYHFIPSDQKDILSTTPYCEQFVSAIQKDNIFGVQFHPEKSQNPGLQLLHNFLSLLK